MGEVIPLLATNLDAEQDAWLAFRALCLTQAADPDLSSNPAWARIMTDAYARWQALFEVA